MRSGDIANTVQINVDYMPHEVYIRRDGEDWAGVTDQKERKKLQNRLNQRARRQRNRQHCRALGVPCRGVFIYSKDMFRDVTDENLGQKREVLIRFAKKALASYATCQPSADHLLRLIQLNVINSLTRNSIVLGLKDDWLLCSAISPFTFSGLGHSIDASAAPCPENLIPTMLQRTIPHHPWVDLFPLPRMRDNFLIAISKDLSGKEEELLWIDLIESGRVNDWTGMIVWGEPWDPGNWEVTMPFLQRWGWLLEGCHEILEATDYWRCQRGDQCVGLELWDGKDRI
ncbi:hypothetical protein F5Y04DRAFT_289003 [Hypomontagnella monticulosa]|nr:hypothetical protein F5Y04DRAFT_289003 [Hypomontagnella monticulosa]